MGLHKPGSSEDCARTKIRIGTVFCEGGGGGGGGGMHGRRREGSQIRMRRIIDGVSVAIQCPLFVKLVSCRKIRRTSLSSLGAVGARKVMCAG